jgi:uncharacterized membrane protein YdjX (TVP38/TMEM64 family)
MPSDQKRRDMLRSLAALCLALLMLMALGYALWRAVIMEGIDVTSLSPVDVQRFAASWGAWSAAAAVLLMVLHSFLPLPAEIIPIANGMMFGPWLGIALTWIGGMLGAVLSFSLARWLGRPFVRLVVADRHWSGVEGLALTPSTLLFVRLLPLISFNLVNYAAGLLGVPWWSFLWTTALGILPLTIAMVLLGGEVLTAPLWLWLLLAAALLALWLVYLGWRNARASPPRALQGEAADLSHGVDPNLDQPRSTRATGDEDGARQPLMRGRGGLE